MRLLAAFDKFKDSFSANEACSILEQASLEWSDRIEVVLCPLTDGGEGFVDILSRRYGGELTVVQARDSLGALKDAQIGWVSMNLLGAETCAYLNLPRQGNLAIIEMASVCGLGDLSSKQRNPWNTSTLGVGDLIAFASENGADAILLGIGGSSTNDAGLGALSVLGLELKSSSGEMIEHPSPATWNDLSIEKSPKLGRIPPLIIACDVSNPLLGKEGATHQFGPQKGLSSDNVDELEQGMEAIVNKLAKIFPQAYQLAELPGTGAAGGIGFGLSLVGQVKLVSGFDLVTRWLRLEEQINQCDFILTGEGRLDATSLRGKGPYELLLLAKKLNKRTFILCGSCDEEIKQTINHEFSSVEVLEIRDKSLGLNENLKDGPKLFKNRCLEILESLPLECPVSREARFKRIRRLKKFLRPLPRRSNVHRYPVLKWFSDTAYAKSYLWSFKGKPIQSALFWGIWISLLPIVGIQMIVVFFVSLLVRANLPIIVALQWISNPLTMGPIYFADYKIGMILLKLLGVDYPQNKLLSAKYDWSHFTYKELVRLIDTFPPMFLGGSVLGVFFAVSTVFLYKILSRFYKN